jgi:AcrR family transcriptional regulator
MIYPLKPARTVERGGTVSTFQRAERHADDDPRSAAPSDMVGPVNAPVSTRQGPRGRTPDKEAILDKAAALFEKRGFHNTTMQHLADELGIAKPTLYAHARTKGDILEGIFERVIRDADEKLKATEAQGERPAEQIRAVISHWTTAAICTRANFKVFIADERELPPRVARYFRRWSGEVIERIRQIIRDGQRRGDFDSSIDPTAATFGIIGASVWASQWYSDEGPLSADDIAESLYTLMMHGLSRS